MLKKTIAFKDLDGNNVLDDFYFNLNKAELIEMELSVEGGLAAHLSHIISSGENTLIVPTFKELLRKSIGRRGADGRQFEKSPEIWQAFEQSNAYEVLFLELVSDAEKAADFLKGCMPADLSAQLENVSLPQDDTHGLRSVPAEDNRPPWIRENREPTKAELVSMTSEQLREVYERKMRSDLA